MDHRELTQKHQKVEADARILALDEVIKMCLPRRIEVPTTLSGFGPKIAKKYRLLHGSLYLAHGENLPALIAIAVSEYWYSCCFSGSYMRLAHEYALHDQAVPVFSLFTARGYSDSEGWAYSFYNGLGDTFPPQERKKFLEGTPYTDLIDDQTLLKSIAVYWFSQAQKADPDQAAEMRYNFLDEAFDALNLQSGISSFDAGVDLMRCEVVSQARSEFGKLGAAARHEPTNKLKSEALRLYVAKSNWPSMRKAANVIAPELRKFCEAEGLTPLSVDREQLTVYEWIRSSPRPLAPKQP